MITSTANSKVKLVRALQSQRKTREHEGLFVLEGVRLLEEAARAQCLPQFVWYTEPLDDRTRAALHALGAPQEAVSDAVMRACSDTPTPQGLLAVLALPTSVVRHPLSFALVLDRIADPGNLGTLLRTADAAGVDAVFLAPGTVDAYNPKVVRAAMGAHFHVPIIETTWETLRDTLSGVSAWVAEAHEGHAYDAVNWREPCALIIGSEAEGPSDAAKAFTAQRVHIPMPGRAESLNAAIAASVLMFEVARQRRLVL